MLNNTPSEHFRTRLENQASLQTEPHEQTSKANCDELRSTAPPPGACTVNKDRTRSRRKKGRVRIRPRSREKDTRESSLPEKKGVRLDLKGRVVGSGSSSRGYTSIIQHTRSDELDALFNLNYRAPIVLSVSVSSRDLCVMQ